MNLSYTESKSIKKKDVNPEKLMIQMQSWFYPTDFMICFKGAYILTFAFSAYISSSFMAEII